jgi:NRAMP (natural resistance-associated macrophage protein)-like metal ion transporter
MTRWRLFCPKSGSAVGRALLHKDRIVQMSIQQEEERREQKRLLSRRRRFWPYLMALGPGLLAASAGNDAGGIATYASAGASFGNGLLWAMVIVTLFVGIVQEMSARLGAVTGKGFSDLVRENFSLRTTALILCAMCIANFGIIVSEFVGIAAAAELFGVSRYLAVPVMAVILWLLITRGSYGRVERIFMALALVFLAYIAAVVLAQPDWNSVGLAIVQPQPQFKAPYLLLLIAIVGTTISPYMQLYIQSSVVEKGVTPEEYRYTRFDVWVGTLFAGIVASSIMIATAVALHPRGITIETAADAALALQPVAGDYARILFGLGLFGASVLAAGVLPLATTYMLSEAIGFERGVSRSWDEAPIFMWLFSGLLFVGAALALIPGLPLIDVLVGVYVLNGLLLPIELVAILRLVNNRELMGEHVNKPIYNLLAWGVVLVISLLSLTLIVTTVLGWFGVAL